MQRSKPVKSKRRAGTGTSPAKRTRSKAPRGAQPKQAPQLAFRQRQSEDDAYIVQLTEEQLGAIHTQSFNEPFPRDQFLRYLQSGAPTVIVERGGKRIGYYSYLVGPDAKMHISAMVIERNHQSDGIGTAVMQQLEKEATGRGVRVLEVFVQASNEKSLAFTRKLGFVEAFRVNPSTICFQKVIGSTAAPNRPAPPIGQEMAPGPEGWPGPGGPVPYSQVPGMPPQPQPGAVPPQPQPGGVPGAANAQGNTNPYAYW